MQINQKTTVSLGIVVIITVAILSILPQCIPLFGNIVTKDWLQINNKQIDKRFESLDRQILKLELLLEKRFDKLDSKLDTLK